MSRVLFTGGGTGGHLMPALALADALRAQRPDVEPVLVGASRGVERTILPTRPYRYHLLPAEPLHRRAWWRNARWPLVLPRLWRSCRQVLTLEEPRLVVGTGGYAAGPMLFVARRARVPIALQEQNARPGLTTRWFASSARQVHLGFPEAIARLRPGRQTTVHALGNPIAAPVSRDRADARRALGLAPDAWVLLVMGGSQGARPINGAVAAALSHGLLEGVSVLWSTGHAAFDAYAAFDARPQVVVRAFWDPIGDAYAAADLVLARAGAMTLAELTAWGLPSILVPLPNAAADHQTANAVALERGGAAIHLPQTRLAAPELARAITDLRSDPERLARMSWAARQRGRPDAAQAIAGRLAELLEPPR